MCPSEKCRGALTDFRNSKLRSRSDYFFDFLELSQGPVGPVDDVEGEEHKWKSVEKNAVDFSQTLGLLHAGDLLLALVHLGALENEAEPVLSEFWYGPVN